MNNSVFGPMPTGMKVYSWFSIIVSQCGLFFLYKTTTADPGAIPIGRASDLRRTSNLDNSEDNENLYKLN